MGFDFAKMIGFGKLGLYFDVKVDGIDGECFTYDIYFKDGLEGKYEETMKVLNDFYNSPEGKKLDLSYTDACKRNESVQLYIDLGSSMRCNEDLCDIMKALNKVTGIEKVVVNEDCEPFDDEDEDFDEE